MKHNSRFADVGASNAGQATESSKQAAKTNDDIKKDSSKGKQAASDEVDAHPTISTLEENRLPTIFVSMIEGHAYKCEECTPKFATELETKLIRNIHRNNTAKLQDQTRTRLTYDLYLSMKPILGGPDAQQLPPALPQNYC